MLALKNAPHSKQICLLVRLQQISSVLSAFFSLCAGHATHLSFVGGRTCTHVQYMPCVTCKGVSSYRKLLVHVLKPSQNA